MARNPAPNALTAPKLARLGGCLALAAAVLAGCGDDGGTASPASAGATTGEAAPAGDGGSGGGVEGTCSGTDLTFTNHDAGIEGTATTALASSGYDGGIYVAHVADFDLTADDLRSWRPEVPAGSNVITIQLTVFNATEDPEPVTPGTEVVVEHDFGNLTFVTRHFTEDGDWNEAQNIGTDTVGTMTITGVGDAFCFEVDYRDQDKEIRGTVEAPVFEEL